MQDNVSSNFEPLFLLRKTSSSSEVLVGQIWSLGPPVRGRCTSWSLANPGGWDPANCKRCKSRLILFTVQTIDNESRNVLPIMQRGGKMWVEGEDFCVHFCAEGIVQTKVHTLQIECIFAWFSWKSLRFFRPQKIEIENTHFFVIINWLSNAKNSYCSYHCFWKNVTNWKTNVMQLEISLNFSTRKHNTGIPSTQGTQGANPFEKVIYKWMHWKSFNFMIDLF